MPGQNSKFRGDEKDWMDRYFAQNVHIFIIYTIFAVEIIGMTRFYFIMPDLCLSQESIFLSTFFLIADFLVVSGLLRSKNADPGYMIPSETDCASREKLIADDSGKKIDHMHTECCKRCGFSKPHERINHCSRCNRCVEYMDHHCVFVDNCIGKRNMPYFF